MRECGSHSRTKDLDLNRVYIESSTLQCLHVCGEIDEVKRFLCQTNPADWPIPLPTFLVPGFRLKRRRLPAVAQLKLPNAEWTYIVNLYGRNVIIPLPIKLQSDPQYYYGWAGLVF